MMKTIAALLVIGLAVFVTPAAHGQCVKENVNYYGTICSKYYTTIRTPDGRYLSVPVVNGYLPSIDEVTECGVTTRTYNYYSGVKHVPGTIPAYTDRCTTAKAPTVTEYYEKPKQPYTYPAPSVSDSYNRPPIITVTSDKRPPVVVESRSYNDDYYKPIYGGSSSSNLEETKKGIQELREKLDKLIDKYDKEKKPITLPAPSANKELEEAKAAISDLREEVKKLRTLTMKYEEDRKAKELEKAPAPTPKEVPKVVPPPITLPAPTPDGMVKPSELGKKKG